ncbi:MAG: single-strand selective monofunctional uracil DNA glycosylase [Planctomycetota bacterium]|jgi:single-strand selective monofunctional uracil DNA glycosylase
MPRPYDLRMSMIRIVRALSRSLSPLTFGHPVTHVYNPLEYARRTGEAYLKRYARPGGRVLLLGMNPGPWGMAQTGVPFGEVSIARDWLEITGKVDKPENEHPKRLIEGFDCTRSEVSGQRLWNWARDRYGTADEFFDHFFVWNFCPLSFMEESGRNRTPDKLPLEERKPLFDVCDAALLKTVEFLKPAQVIGIGKFAEKQATRALKSLDVPIGTILHPSPASPMANRGWVKQIEPQFEALGIKL